MAKKVSNFKDPIQRAKAHAAAKGKPRPGRMSKKKLELKAKVEIVKEELLRQGYLKQIAPHLESITKVHIAMAKRKDRTGTMERRMFFENTNIKEDKVAEALNGMGAILAEMAQMEE